MISNLNGSGSLKKSGFYRFAVQVRVRFDYLREITQILIFRYFFSRSMCSNCLVSLPLAKIFGSTRLNSMQKFFVQGFSPLFPRKIWYFLQIDTRCMISSLPVSGFKKALDAILQRLRRVSRGSC